MERLGVRGGAEFHRNSPVPAPESDPVTARAVPDIVQKRDGELASVTRAHANQRIGFRHHRIRRDQRPGFSCGLFKERASLEVVAILGDEVRKEGAGVDEDPFHGFVA